MTTPSTGTSHAVIAGVVCGVVGFTSSFAVVLTGLRAVGASSDQAASGLLALCVVMGLGTLLFSWRLRMPLTMAWSTPGAALLATATVPAGGFATAVGAFIVSGVLLTIAALFRPLAKLVAAIPTALANAMLAGVLLTLCVVPFRAVVHDPWAIAPVMLTWLVFVVIARRWAVPAALGAAVVVLFWRGSFAAVSGQPSLTVVTPHFSLAAAIAIGVPLFIVTMTSQNIPGIAVLASFGYRPVMRGPLSYAGGASIGSAFAGGHAINLAAISAALAAGPSAHPLPQRRWIAGVACGVSYLLFAPFSKFISTLAAAAPSGLLETIAGLALIATFAAAASSALADEHHREAGAVTFVVAASGMTVAGVGAAFWGLVAGAIMLGATRLAARRAQ